jgi:hypothetical protein
MSAKAVGSIRNVSQKSVGKLYRPSETQSRDTSPSGMNTGLLGYDKLGHHSSGKKRSSSVGRIYNTHLLESQKSLPR